MRNIIWEHYKTSIKCWISNKRRPLLNAGVSDFCPCSNKLQVSNKRLDAGVPKPVFQTWIQNLLIHDQD